mgnify:CR=1 FL=1|tara:strand:- start:2031 stop:3785 length:1755 start_codon:yes stop_codon:yes gene_type:complete
MTAAASRNPEPYEVPQGGLGSFLTATVGDWSDEALNADNYYDIVKPTADQLAEFGREEDDRIAHVATGETIIPMAVFEEDPELKNVVFNRMRDMGIDPERYIVGNELNSINPVTGQPEFFLKKLFKGVKKLVKGVVKVFKKVAPIILTVGLNVMFPGLGTIASAALGSGIGTLVQGGDLKDALKAAAIGGATAGVTSGISNVVKAAVPGGSAGGTFMEGVKSGLPGGGPVAASSVGADAVSDAVSGPPVTASEALAAAKGQGVGATVGAGADGLTYMPGPYPGDTAGMLVSTNDPTVSLGQTGTQNALEEVVVTAQNLQPKTPNFATAAFAATPAVAQVQTARDEAFIDETLRGPEETGPVSRTGDLLFKAGETPAQTALKAKLAGTQAYDNVLEKYADLSPDLLTKANEFKIFQEATKASEAAKAAYAPKLFGSEMLAKYGPAALGITGLAAAAGAFDVPEQESLEGDMYGGMTGMDLLRMNPELYRTRLNAGSRYVPVPVSARTGSQRIGAAAGGGITSTNFPRRDGAISGPGTETSDDIPAMLSDGEFVMTARAVRGAGNGSREDGMRNMYSMMSRFEGAA